MNFATAASTAADPEAAVYEIIDTLKAQASGFDVAMVFYTPQFCGDADSIAQTLIDKFDLPCVIGASFEGVIASGQEYEKGPALSVMVGRLPGVRIQPFHLSQSQWQAALADAESFNDHFGMTDQTRAIVAMGDPWTTPLGNILEKFNQFRPTIPIIGGMASSARKAGENVLLFNDARFNEGMVGLSLSGPVRVDTIVSQGCRPIGRPQLITKGQGNVIEHLGGRPALTVLEETVNSLNPHDKSLLASGLLIGRAMNEYKSSLAQGDFVIRSIIGVDDEIKAIGIGDRIKVGQTVQFHVRDAASAHQDLHQLLAAQQSHQPAAAILFTCNGRGSRLFNQPHHDAKMVDASFPGVPLAGCFAAGEIGPVGSCNFSHSHTASLVLISPETTP